MNIEKCLLFVVATSCTWYVNVLLLEYYFIIIFIIFAFCDEMKSNYAEPLSVGCKSGVLK